MSRIENNKKKRERETLYIFFYRTKEFTTVDTSMMIMMMIIIIIIKIKYIDTIEWTQWCIMNKQIGFTITTVKKKTERKKERIWWSICTCTHWEWNGCCFTAFIHLFIHCKLYKIFLYCSCVYKHNCKICFSIFAFVKFHFSSCDSGLLVYTKRFSNEKWCLCLRI